MSDAAGIAIPLVTGIGGLLIGAGFSRVTSRNDQRRQQYANALSAIEKLSASAGEDAAAVAEATWRVVEIANWIELDSVPVSNAFKALRAAAGDDAKVREAREGFVDVAHRYSSWRLPQRFWLQVGAKRRPTGPGPSARAHRRPEGP